MSDFALVDGHRYEVRDGVLVQAEKCFVCKGNQGGLMPGRFETPTGPRPMCIQCTFHADMRKRGFVR